MNRLTVLFSFILSCFLLLFLSFSCRLYKLERKLDPVNAEFLSKVRYIITGEERKTFLELPDSEKEEFREAFWERRDPDPDTEENEFKKAYFDRIERANKLFMGEARAGWKTDRGRIYILLGPPTDRITYPMGSDPYSYGREIWYYGSFPVLFLDTEGTGIYRLETYNLSPVRDINLMYMHELNLSQEEARKILIRKTLERPEGFLDFDWSVKKTLAETERIEGVVIIDIPYAGIWFKAEDERMKTTLDVHLELEDSEGNIIWDYEKAYEIEMKEEELEKRQEENYKIEIPFILEENLETLRRGENLLRAVIKNRTGEEESEKVMEFKL